MGNSTDIELLSVKFTWHMQGVLKEEFALAMYVLPLTHTQLQLDLLILEWQLHNNCHISCRMFLYVMINEWHETYTFLICWIKIVF